MAEITVTPQQRKNYYVLILSVVSMQITASTIYMVLPLFFEQYGITKTENGVLISIGTLAGVFSGLIAGKFSDNYGRKWFLVGGTAVYSVVFYLFAFLSKDFNTFFALRFLEGIGFYVMPVLVAAMCADTFPAGERGRMMALFSMAGGIGQLIGPLMAPYLIIGDDFNIYFIFSGTFVVISCLCMAFLVKETLPKEQRVERDRSGKGFTVGAFLGSVKALGVAFLVLLAAILFYRTGYTMIDPFFSIYLRDVIKLDLSSTSYIFALRAICTLAFAPVAGWMADRFGRKPTFLIGMVMTVIALFGYTQMRGTFDIYLVRGVDAVASVILINSIRTYTADLLAPRVRGFGMGLYSTISQESSTVGAIFGGYVIDVLGFNMVFLAAAALSGVALLIVQLWVPEPGR
ncbi:MAG: MFS transporter, partial [Candidatus Bathyarchaeota archaeon]|nr:MFS transporter [Candidatus Bathyarchaeota archaeon]